MGNLYNLTRTKQNYFFPHFWGYIMNTNTTTKDIKNLLSYVYIVKSSDVGQHSRLKNVFYIKNIRDGDDLLVSVRVKKSGLIEVHTLAIKVDNARWITGIKYRPTNTSTYCRHYAWFIGIKEKLNARLATATY